MLHRSLKTDHLWYNWYSLSGHLCNPTYKFFPSSYVRRCFLEIILTDVLYRLMGSPILIVMPLSCTQLEGVASLAAQHGRAGFCWSKPLWLWFLPLPHSPSTQQHLSPQTLSQITRKSLEFFPLLCVVSVWGWGQHHLHAQSAVNVLYAMFMTLSLGRTLVLLALNSSELGSNF